jgi:cytochrome c oxidase assembly factor CtaG
VTGTPAPGRGPARWLVLVAGLVLLAMTTGVLLAVLAPSVSSLYGLPTPGVAVEALLPAARVVGILAAAAAVAHLLVAALLVPGDPYDVVSRDGYAGLRALRWCAAVQVLAYLVIAWLTIVENTGLGPGQLLANGSALLNGAEQIEQATGWLLGALLASAVGLLACWTLSWRGAVGLLVLELAVQLPVTLTSATDAQRSHDIAGDALTLHVLGALLWLGSALAVVTLLSRGSEVGHPVLRRHAAIAAWALPIVGISGMVSAAYAITWSDLFTSGYGRLAVGSVLVLAALVPVGRRLRARAVTDRPRASATRLMVVELALLTLASALGTGLTRLIPPAQVGYDTSRFVYLIGYDLPAHLTAADLLLRWRPDLVFGPLAVLAAVLYLLGVRQCRRGGMPWPIGQTLAWLAGCAVLLMATSSGLGTYAPAVFSVHMVQHMLLATMAPTLLVLGHGVSLLLRVAPPCAARGLTSLLHSPLIRFVRSPFAAWFAVGLTLFGLYPTGLYGAILQEHWAHLGMDAAFFLTGLALFWSVLGHSPGRSALPPIGQIVMIFALMVLHAGFSAWLLGQATPLAAEFYGALRLPYVPDMLADQRLGAILGWASAELPVIFAVVALVCRWTTQDRAGRADSDGPGVAHRSLSTAQPVGDRD